MGDDRNVIDQALDVLVYAPLGLALEAKDLIPKLAERGRGQVALARLAGRFAAERGQHQARRVFDGPVKDEAGSPAPRQPESSPVPRPFDGYDDLDARQVISLLEQMSDHELRVTYAYEQHHRARSTIINRIQQLQDRHDRPQ